MSDNTAQIKVLKHPKPASRSDIINTLTDLLVLAKQRKIEYLEVTAHFEGDSMEYYKQHLDGTYSYPRT